jgi:hypothetical protein
MQEKKNDNYLKLGEGKPLRVSLGVSNGVELNGDDGLWPLVGLVRSLSACFQFKKKKRKNERRSKLQNNHRTRHDRQNQKTNRKRKKMKWNGMRTYRFESGWVTDVSVTIAVCTKVVRSAWKVVGQSTIPPCYSTPTC